MYEIFQMKYMNIWIYEYLNLDYEIAIWYKKTHV